MAHPLARALGSERGGALLSRGDPVPSGTLRFAVAKSSPTEWAPIGTCLPTSLCRASPRTWSRWRSAFRSCCSRSLGRVEGRAPATSRCPEQSRTCSSSTSCTWGWEDNSLFLLWVALVLIASQALFRLLLAVPPAAFATKSQSVLRRRYVGGFLLVNGALITLLWLQVIVPPLLDGRLYPAGRAISRR